MNLLIVAQKVDKNDAVLGFFHDWVAEFATKAEKVLVLCLEKGELDLPKNVEVVSMGKEQLKNRVSVFNVRRRILYLSRFLPFVVRRRNDYDVVFVHMIPLYALVGLLFWKIFRKKSYLWYAHGHVPLSLRISAFMLDGIFSSTPEGCRLESDKLKIVGQGIDLKRFENIPNRSSDSFYRIVAIGRIAPVKDYETLIRATSEVVNKHKKKNVRLRIIGAALLDQHEHYFRKLKKLVADEKLEKYVEFTGSVPYTNIAQYLQQSHLMASTSRTGSLDKVMLEALASGVLLLTCNESIKSLLAKDAERFMFEAGDHVTLAKKIAQVMAIPEKERAGIIKKLRKRIGEEHGLKALVSKIMNTTSLN